MGLLIKFWNDLEHILDTMPYLQNVGALCDTNMQPGPRPLLTVLNFPLFSSSVLWVSCRILWES